MPYLFKITMSNMKLNRKQLKKLIEEEAKKILKGLTIKPEEADISEAGTETAPNPTTKPAPTKTPDKERQKNPIKIPKPGTFPKPAPKAKDEKSLKIKAEEIIKEWFSTIKLEEEKSRMKLLMTEALNIEPGQHNPHPSIKRGIEGQSETPFGAIELFSKQRLDQSTLEKIGGEEFNQIVRHLNDAGQMGMMEIQNALNMIVTYEMPHRNTLETLAKNIIQNKFGLSDEIMDMIDAKLKNPGEIDPPDNDTPEEEAEQQFTPEELTLIKKHVDKRIVHNTLMMGAGYRAHKVFGELKNTLDGIDERLYPLYSRMMANVELFLWKMPVEEMFGARQMWGKSEMKEENGENKAEATAIMFPVLLHEVAKAAVEILFLQHLSDVQEKHGEAIAKAVVKKADSYMDEHWLKLIGPNLWKYLHDALLFVVAEKGEDHTIIAYVLNRMASLEPEAFMELMDNAIHDGPIAIEKIKTIIDEVRNDIDAYENQNDEIPSPEDIEIGDDHSADIADLLKHSEDELLTRTPEERPKPLKKKLEDMDVTELNNSLESALNTEDYVTAAKIRDILKSRK